MMAILDLKQPSIESIAPDRDTIVDSVNPLGGLKDVAHGLNSLTQVFEQRLQDHILSQAMTDYTSIEADHRIKHAQHILKQDPSDPEKAYQSIKGYSDELDAEREKYASTINNRSVREHIRGLSSNTKSHMTKTGLEHTLGAMKQKSITNISTYATEASKLVYLNSDKASYDQALEGLSQVVNSADIPMQEKEATFRQGKNTLNLAHARGSHNKSPYSFNQDLIITHEARQQESDPLKASSIADSAGEVKVDVANAIVQKIDGDLGIGFNQLSLADQRSLQKEWATEVTSSYAKARPPIAKDIKAFEASCLKGEKPSTQLDVKSRSVLSTAYSPEVVEQIVNRLEMFERLQPFMGKVRTGTAEDLEDVKAELIKEGMQHHIPIADREHRKSMHALMADPLKWHESNNLIPELNFENDQFGKTLALRTAGIKESEKKFNMSIRDIIGKAGEKRLIDKIKNEPSSAVVSFLSSETAGLHDDDKARVKEAFRVAEDVALSVGGILSMEDSGAAKEAASTIFAGSKNKEAINVQYKKENTGHTVEYDARSHISARLSGLFSGFETSGYKRSSDAIVLHIIGTKQLKNNPSGAVSKADVDYSIKEALGSLPMKIGNSTTIPRRGENPRDYQNRRYIAISKALKDGKDRAVNPDRVDTTYVDMGREALVYQGNPILDKDGNPKIIDINQLTSEDFKNPEFKNYSRQQGLKDFKVILKEHSKTLEEHNPTIMGKLDAFETYAKKRGLAW